MKDKRRLIIVGAGGAGIEALWVAQRSGEWEAVGFVDDAPGLAGQVVAGVAVLGPVGGTAEKYGRDGVWFHCAIGGNDTRRRIAAELERAGLSPASLIDPSAVIAPSARIGAGTYVAPQAFIGPRAGIGRFALINAGASIGHDSRLGDFVQVCPGARVSGECRLEEGAFIGSNGVVTPGVGVGAWAVVAAASLAARDVPPRTTAIGVPAKFLAPPRTE